MDGMVLLLAVLVCALVLPALLIGVVYLATRVSRRRRAEGTDVARALLDRRLASGEIGLDEYYERESALRSAEPANPPRGRRKPY